MFNKAVEYKQEEMLYQTYLFDRLLMALTGKAINYQDYKKRLYQKPEPPKNDNYYANIIKSKDFR